MGRDLGKALRNKWRKEEEEITGNVVYIKEKRYFPFWEKIKNWFRRKK